mmetsp:Transcript_67054/g.131508  ORF Transcript_67054/g.131508 Transcript_67054/m.131508 type:complete len:178 (-) Transcript_67054:84-617(-)
MAADDGDIIFEIADYSNPTHKEAIEVMMAQYAEDPMGGGEALDPSILSSLAGELAKVPGAFTVIALAKGPSFPFLSATCDQPAGLVNCFMGFSTFACKPLVNVHDCAVHPDYRRRGVCSRMLACCEAEARKRGCCKITLEVLANNNVAKAAYVKDGYVGYELDPAMGGAEFWQKKLK